MAGYVGEYSIEWRNVDGFLTHSDTESPCRYGTEARAQTPAFLETQDCEC